jgi:ubiquinol-cytochrome c reductase cytochrome b subunit
MATHLHVSVEAVTWTVRVGLFAVPVLAFSVTKRVALGLQRQDREAVLHGRESGIIKRLPNGEYVEVHEPLGQERLHVLTARTQVRPLEAAPVRDTDGTLSRGVQRLRVTLSRFLHGPGTQIPEPTAAEYGQIHGGRPLSLSRTGRTPGQEDERS